MPAHYGREVVRSTARRALAGLALIIAVTLGAGAATSWRGTTFIAIECSAIAAMFLIDRVVMPRLDRRERGNNAEIKVGGILESLRGAGWRVLHDVDTGRGNIDHVLVGPAGLLTVETKSRRGRVSTTSLNPAWLSQAYAQRKWLENVTGQPVDSLLVFSDAWLDRMVSRKRGVCVLPARALPGHLGRRPQRLAPGEVDALYDRLARALAA